MKRLKENHSTVIKLEKVIDLMEKLGLTISVGSWGQYIVTDAEQADKEFYLKSVDVNDEVLEFPPVTEFKIIYED